MMGQTAMRSTVETTLARMDRRIEILRKAAMEGAEGEPGYMKGVNPFARHYFALQRQREKILFDLANERDEGYIRRIEAKA
jgi:hypothetical protein